MITYSEFKPTSLDHNIDINRELWLVLPVSHNRDSDLLEESNWETSIKIFQDYGFTESEDTFEIHRFGHWGCGWFEIILINPTNIKCIKIGEEIEESLENYPVLDDEDYSEKEFEMLSDYVNDELHDEVYGNLTYCHYESEIEIDGVLLLEYQLEDICESLGIDRYELLFKAIEDLGLEITENNWLSNEEIDKVREYVENYITEKINSFKERKTDQIYQNNGILCQDDLFEFKPYQRIIDTNTAISFLTL